MPLRILILGLAVTVCALWPQGVVLCVGHDEAAESAPCCPSGRHGDEAGNRHHDEPGPHDCADCSDTESPELASVLPAPAIPAPVATPAAVVEWIAPARPAAELPASLSPDERRTPILVV